MNIEYKKKMLTSRNKDQKRQLEGLIRSGERLNENEKNSLGKEFDELMQLAELLVKGGK